MTFPPLPMVQRIALLSILTSFLLPVLPAFAGGDVGGMAALSQRMKPAAVVEDAHLWQIETNLPSNHPCAVAGGVWRGWCIDLAAIKKAAHVSVRGPASPSMRRSVARSFSVRGIADVCLGMTDFVQRRACYRDQRLYYSGGGK